MAAAKQQCSSQEEMPPQNLSAMIDYYNYDPEYKERSSPSQAEKKSTGTRRKTSRPVSGIPLDHMFLSSSSSNRSHETACSSSLQPKPVISNSVARYKEGSNTAGKVTQEGDLIAAPFPKHRREPLAGATRRHSPGTTVVHGPNTMVVHRQGLECSNNNKAIIEKKTTKLDPLRFQQKLLENIQKEAERSNKMGGGWE